MITILIVQDSDMDITKNLYHYWAKVTSVYDGDTITGNMSLFNRIRKENQKLRLYGLNTPELRGGTKLTKLAGRESRDFLREQILDKWVVIETIKDKKGKYGRILAIIWLPEFQKEPYGDFTNINEILISNGYAEPKIY